MGRLPSAGKRKRVLHADAAQELTQA